MPIIIIVALLLGGGGTSFAAQSSLPGDVLYPVKIHVNEAVRSSLTFSTASKASLETELAEARLKETEELAAEGKMNAAMHKVAEVRKFLEAKKASLSPEASTNNSPHGP